MTPAGESAKGWLLALAVLLFGSALCFLILWGGTHLAALVLTSAVHGPSNPPVDETIVSSMIFGLLLIAGLAGGAACRVNAARLGASAGRALAHGALVGFGALLIGIALAGIAGEIRSSGGGSSAGLMLWGTALIGLQAASEEIFFRGWMQPVLVRAWGGAGLVVTAAAFALLHLFAGAGSAVSVLNLFLGGLLFGLLAYRYGGVAAATAAHFAYNWAEQLVFGLDPNPGVGSFGSILNLELVGSAWWGGSTEGLNASVGMTFAMAVMLAPLLIVAPTIGRSLELRRPGRAPA